MCKIPDMIFYTDKNAIVKTTREMHGFSKTKEEYVVWKSMIYRCTNKNYKEYKYYGEKGIGVCHDWYFSFRRFLQDMGERPSKLHQIDRKDNSIGYCKENCQWTIGVLNSVNRSTGRKIKMHRGVCLKNGKYFEASIRINYKLFFIGSYKTEKEAGEAYNLVAKKWWGFVPKNN